ncbi:hypothetical protein KVR01_010707 [Diaporthe batatas]|uniref:uncharacterized protein n=1 Tax=Diaporthe batatas TaxID=748121 RepID=UPI001D052E54|nr:uncharacterized protein KVR01_010707 [Diaporthe batatas]KAG8160070.1 hypothetical protein KVR01_010707 [Diaporthe batatas]
MAATLTVMYPNEADAKYDIEYYKTQHMPLMERLLGKYGVKSWTVTTYLPSADGSAAPYVFSSTVTWTSAQAIKEAFADESAPQILADVANFSNKQPVFLVGEITGSSA